MFNWVGDLFNRFFASFVWWVLVQPWEQGVRTRMGKHVKRLTPGFHWKLPFIDQVAVMTAAYRNAQIHTQTLSTSDNQTVVTGGTVGYSIENMETLYRKLYHAEDTISQEAAAAIAQVVQTTTKDDINPFMVAEKASALVQNKLREYGLGNIQFRLTDFAFVKTFRLVNDARYAYGGVLPQVSSRNPY